MIAGRKQPHTAMCNISNASWLPVQSSEKEDDSNKWFKSPTHSHSTTSSTTQSQECLRFENGIQTMENNTPPSNNNAYRMDLEETVPRDIPSDSVVGEMHSNDSEDLLPPQAAISDQSDTLFLSVESQQESFQSYHSRRLQSTSVPSGAYSSIPRLPSSSGIKLPPSMKLGGSRQEEMVTGIRYPPSWGRAPLSQGTSRKMSERSDQSLYSNESLHRTDYDLLTSLDPPRTKIMYEESLSERLENNISIKTSDTKGDDTSATIIGLCQICYDKKIECIFLPCGHARTCEECATRIKNSGQPCPYCRKGVSTIHHIYL